MGSEIIWSLKCYFVISWNMAYNRRWTQESSDTTSWKYIYNNIPAPGCRICSSDLGPGHTEYFHHPQPTSTCNTELSKSIHTFKEKNKNLNWIFQSDMFEPDFENLPQTRSTRSGSGRKSNRDQDSSLRCISCLKSFRSKSTYERHVDRCLDAIEATNERKLKKLR